MAEKILYPNLSDAMLTPFRVIMVLQKTNPDLLDRSDCPYSDDMKTFLRRLTGAETGGGEAGEIKLDYDDLEGYVVQTLEDMRRLENQLSTLDQKDKVQFLKAKPGLIEKLIELKERVVNLKSMSDFMKRVYAFIDRELTPDQRTALTTTLKTHLEAVE